VPRQYAAQSRRPGEERPERRAWYFGTPGRLADLRGSTQQASAGVYKDPEPPVGGLVATARGKSSDDRFGSRVPRLH